MTDTDDTEEWREVPGFPAYRVSSHGRVWSGQRHGHIKAGTAWGGGRILKLLHKAGYPYVVLYPGQRHFFVHQLVTLAFIGPCPPGQEVRHIHDYTKTNVHASNLGYGTPSENAHDRSRHGTNPNVAKTHCLRGHLFNAENTLLRRDGLGRECRACRSAAMRAYRLKRRTPA
jgi:hypothetical protein